MLYQKFLFGFIFALSLFSIFPLGSHAACTSGPTTSTAGKVVQTNGCWRDTSGNEYSYNAGPSSTSSAPGTPLGDATPANENDNIYNLSKEKLRTGNITLGDIPVMIVSVIEFVLFLAGTACVVAIIYHAVRMQIASGITGDSSGVDKAKNGVKGAMIGFVVSMSAWWIMTKLVAVFAGVN